MTSQMFDAFNNHVEGGMEVKLVVDGFSFEDQLGINRKVENLKSLLHDVLVYSWVKHVGIGCVIVPC